jgi:uncharacterized lipoprotein YmbA
MMTIWEKRFALAFCFAGTVLAGCSSSSEPARLYVMDATQRYATVRPVSAQEAPIVAVAGVKLPEYLNQNGIVTRDSNNEITRADSNIWAGSLSEEIARTIAENISVMLPSDRVTLNAGRRSIPVDYTVDVEIVNFERDAAVKNVDLVATWVVFRGDERSMLAMRRSRFSKPVAGSEYKDTVAAMSEALAALCEEITSTINRGPGRTDRFASGRSTQRQMSGEGATRRR